MASGLPRPPTHTQVGTDEYATSPLLFRSWKEFDTRAVLPERPGQYEEVYAWLSVMINDSSETDWDLQPLAGKVRTFPSIFISQMNCSSLCQLEALQIAAYEDSTSPIHLSLHSRLFSFKEVKTPVFIYWSAGGAAGRREFVERRGGGVVQ